MVLFLTAHLPEGFPRVSQPQAGSRQTFRLAFISVASSLLSFSFRCFHLMYGLFAPLPFSISYAHSLFPFPVTPPLLPGWIWGEACFCWCVLCALCCIYMLRLTCTVQKRVATDLVPFLFPLFFVFCYVTQAHTSSLARKKARTERDKIQIMTSVGFSPGFDTCSIPTPVSKWSQCCWRSYAAHLVAGVLTEADVTMSKPCL